AGACNKAGGREESLVFHHQPGRGGRGRRWSPRSFCQTAFSFLPADPPPAMTTTSLFVNGCFRMTYPYHCLMLSLNTINPNMATTATSTASRYKGNDSPAANGAALARNMPNISYDPVSVTNPTKSIGTAATQRNEAFHILINTVVPIQSASVPSN